MASSLAARSLLRPAPSAAYAMRAAEVVPETDTDTESDTDTTKEQPHCRLFDQRKFGTRAARITELPGIPVVAPGQKHVTVSWTVRNESGSAWPEGVVLQQYRRHAQLQVTGTTVNPPAPGHEAQCSVTFTAPTEPGLHFGVFDLQKPSGCWFFRTVAQLPMLVEVTGAPRRPGAGSPAPDEPEGSRALARLRAAGFTDEARNVRALLLLQGSTSAALGALAFTEICSERKQRWL